MKRVAIWLNSWTQPIVILTCLAVVGSACVLAYRVSQVELVADSAARFAREVERSNVAEHANLRERINLQEATLSELKTHVLYIKQKVEMIDSRLSNFKP